MKVSNGVSLGTKEDTNCQNTAHYSTAVSGRASGPGTIISIFIACSSPQVVETAIGPSPDSPLPVCAHSQFLDVSGGKLESTSPSTSACLGTNPWPDRLLAVIADLERNAISLLRWTCSGRSWFRIRIFGEIWIRGV